jgi:hypothetical protein
MDHLSGVASLAKQHRSLDHLSGVVSLAKQHRSLDELSGVASLAKQHRSMDHLSGVVSLAKQHRSMDHLSGVVSLAKQHRSVDHLSGVASLAKQHRSLVTRLGATNESHETHFEEMDEGFSADNREGFADTLPSIVPIPGSRVAAECWICGSPLLHTVEHEPGQDCINIRIVPGCLECTRRMQEDPEYMAECLRQVESFFFSEPERCPVVFEGEGLGDGVRRGPLRLVRQERLDESDE